MTQSTSALLDALGENQQLVLVLVTQPMSSHPCPCPLPCRHQGIQAHAKEAHSSPRSLHTSLAGFFQQVLRVQGLSPSFDSSLQGRSIRQEPLPCALI